MFLPAQARLPGPFRVMRVPRRRRKIPAHAQSAVSVVAGDGVLGLVEHRAVVSGMRSLVMDGRGRRLVLVGDEVTERRQSEVTALRTRGPTGEQCR